MGVCGIGSDTQKDTDMWEHDGSIVHTKSCAMYVIAALFLSMQPHQHLWPVWTARDWFGEGHMFLYPEVCLVDTHLITFDVAVGVARLQLSE